jgi:hypothetical protein
VFFKIVSRLYYLLCPLPLLDILWPNVTSVGVNGPMATVIICALEPTMVLWGVGLLLFASKEKVRNVRIALIISALPAIIGVPAIIFKLLYINLGGNPN